ncbi:unnamed protein product [Brassicogethes aeneus]|uniref:Ionotropic glutamate receptor L-glutamate and glycine-binding domain-containing protein n=1 Tax=Brassicogethes aeneus TaxID=1431903 RepID=A0A9P0FGW1_BRAAE|nr:unnamed protein product [Brassicogethes aeneus]
MILIGVLLLKVLLVNGKIRPDLENIDESFELCLKNVVMTFKEDDETIININENSNFDIMQNLIKSRNFRYYWPYMQNVHTGKYYISSQNIKNFFIVNINDVDQLDFYLRKLKMLLIWNSRGKFVIVLLKRNVKLIKNIFKVLWKYNIYKSIVLQKITNETANVYAWYPYSKTNCGNNFNEIQIINKCEKDGLKKSVDVFDQSMFDLFACTFKVRTIFWQPFIINSTDGPKGIEVSLLNTLADKLNMKLSYSLSSTPLNWGAILENGTVTGIFQHMQEGKSDIAVAALGYEKNRVNYMDIGMPYFYDYLTYCVPPFCKSDWDKIIIIFDYQSWIIIIVAYFSFSFVLYYVSKRCEDESMIFKNIYNVLLINFSMVINTMGKLPKTDVRLLMDIIDLKLKLQFLLPQKRYFADDSPQSEYIKEHWNNCKNIPSCLKRVIKEKDSVMCISKVYIDTIKNCYIDKNKKPLFHCFPKYFVAFPITMLMRKDFPLRNRINDVIIRIYDSGLIQFWKRQYNNECKPQKTSTEEQIQRKLNL